MDNPEGFWIMTRTGRKVELEHPNIDDINIHDIAYSLSQIPRWNGHLNVFTSVAQHCCVVSDLLPDELKLAGLLHDAEEAYIGDITNPFKQILKRDKHFRFILEEWNDCIQTKFCVNFSNSKIREADLLSLSMEAMQRFDGKDSTYLELLDPATYASAKDYPELPVWGSLEAEGEFMMRFSDLHG